MKLRLEVHVGSEFIKSMIALYINSDRPFKKLAFKSWMKEQVALFGSDYDSQFGEGFSENYSKELLIADEIYEEFF